MKKQNKEKTAKLAGVYKDIANYIDYETAEKMHYMFKGQQVSFPVRFYDTKVIEKEIIKNYNSGISVRELALCYGYTERRIRQIVKKEKHKFKR